MSAFKDSPISFLANRFGASESMIKAYLYKAPRRYKQYEIQKRGSDKKRAIAQPTKALKIMQRAVVKEFLFTLPIHDCANAYIKNRGIKSNVLPHISNNFLLKMDFSDFFPSILPRDLLFHVEQFLGKPNEEELFILENLFFFSPYNGAPLRLSIGAPSSPFLSNTIMYPFDELLTQNCKNSDIIYTRYADDLALSTSTKNILYGFPEKIADICEKLSYPRLEINRDKTVFTSKAKNRHITGLVISNQELISLGHRKKRYIRSLIYQHLNGNLPANQLLMLRGLIAFAKDVEPSFLESIKRKFGADVIRKINAAKLEE